MAVNARNIIGNCNGAHINRKFGAVSERKSGTCTYATSAAAKCAAVPECARQCAQLGN